MKIDDFAKIDDFYDFEQNSEIRKKCKNRDFFDFYDLYNPKKPKNFDFLGLQTWIYSSKNAFFSDLGKKSILGSKNPPKRDFKITVHFPNKKKFTGGGRSFSKNAIFN